MHENFNCYGEIWGMHRSIMQKNNKNTLSRFQPRIILRSSFRIKILQLANSLRSNSASCLTDFKPAFAKNYNRVLQMFAKYFYYFLSVVHNHANVMVNVIKYFTALGITLNVIYYLFYNFCCLLRVCLSFCFLHYISNDGAECFFLPTKV